MIEAATLTARLHRRVRAVAAVGDAAGCRGAAVQRDCHCCSSRRTISSSMRALVGQWIRRRSSPRRYSRMVTSGLPPPSRSRVRSSPAPAQRPVSAIRGSGSVRGVTRIEAVGGDASGRGRPCRSGRPPARASARSGSDRGVGVHQVAQRRAAAAAAAGRARSAGARRAPAGSSSSSSSIPVRAAGVADLDLDLGGLARPRPGGR